jgi:hypothetical protein
VLLHYMRHLIAQEHGKLKPGGGKVTLEDIADRVGVSKTQIINVRDRDRGAGPDTIDGFARAFHSGSRDALYAAAEQHAKAAPPAPARVVERDDEFGAYPNLRALTMTTDWADASERARHEVLALRGSGGDMGIGDWLEELRSAERRSRRGQRADVTTDALGREAEEDVVEDTDTGGRQ